MNDSWDSDLMDNEKDVVSPLRNSAVQNGLGKFSESTDFIPNVGFDFDSHSNSGKSPLSLQKGISLKVGNPGAFSERKSPGLAVDESRSSTSTPPNVVADPITGGNSNRERPESGRVVFDSPVDYFDNQGGNDDDDLDEDDWDAQLIIEQSAYEPKHLHEPGPLAMSLQGILGAGPGANNLQQNGKGATSTNNAGDVGQTVHESLLEYLEAAVLKEMFPDFGALNDSNALCTDGSDGGGSNGGRHGDSHETMGIPSNRSYGEPSDTTQKSLHQSFSNQKHLKGFPEWLLSTCSKLKSSVLLTPYSHNVDELFRRARLPAGSGTVTTTSVAQPSMSTTDGPSIPHSRMAKNVRAAYIATNKGTDTTLHNAEHALSETLNKMAYLGASARVLLEVDANQSVVVAEDDNELNLRFYDAVLQQCEEDPTKEECVTALEDATRWIRSLCHMQPPPPTQSTAGFSLPRTASANVESTRFSSSSMHGGETQSARDSTRHSWYGSLRMYHSSGGATRTAVSSSAPATEPAVGVNNGLHCSEADLLDLNTHEAITLIRGPASAPLRPSELFKGISYRKFDKIFSSCDYILNEQSQFTTGRILQLYSILLNGIESLPASPNPLNKALLLDPELATAVTEMMQDLTKMVHICRMKIQMLEIKIHVNQNVDLFTILQNLRYIADELQTINDAWLRTLVLFLRSDEEVGVPSAASRGTVLDGSNHSKQSSASQTAASSSGNTATISKEDNMTPGVTHTSPVPYSLRHGEVLQKVLADLQGLCFADTLLMVTRVSPITFRKLQGSSGIYSKAVKNKDQKKGRPKSKYSMDDDDDDERTSLLPTYNVAYELGICGRFASLIGKIPSPSIVRSKLFYAAFLYHQELYNDALPWQQKNKYKLSSVAQSTEGYQIKYVNTALDGAEAEEFGIGSGDLDTDSYKISVVEVESAILQSFTEALGSHNAIRMQQLLLYLAANDVLPTSSSTVQPLIQAGSPRRKTTGSRKRMSDVFEFDTDRGGDGSEYAQTTNSSVVSGELAPGLIGNVAAATTSASLRSASMCLFPHIPMAIDVMQSIRDKIAEVSRDRDRLLSLHQPSQSISASKPVGDPKPHKTNYIVRYELFNFIYLLLTDLADHIYDLSPHSSLDLRDACVQVLSHIGDPMREFKQYQREVGLLASRIGRNYSAILHLSPYLTEARLSALRWVTRELQLHKANAATAIGVGGAGAPQTAMEHSLQVEGNEHIPQMLFLTKLVSEQFQETAQYDLAAKTILDTIDTLHKVRSITQELNAVINYDIIKSKKKERKLVDRSSKMKHQQGSSLLGCCAATIDTDPNDLVAADENALHPSVPLKNILCPDLVFARAATPLYFELGRVLLAFGAPDRAADAFQAMLQVYQLQCANAQYGTVASAGAIEKVTALSKLAECYIAMGDIPTALKVIDGIQRIREYIALVVSGGTVGDDFRALLERIPSGLSRDSGSSDMHSNGYSNNMLLEEAFACAGQLHCPDSSLPKFCPSLAGDDLGELKARAFFFAKQHVHALQSLAPTVMGVEMITGGKGSSKSAMMELARLYFLRGEILLDAAGAASAVEYPFDVGGGGAFTSVRKQAAYILQLCGRSFSGVMSSTGSGRNNNATGNTISSISIRSRYSRTSRPPLVTDMRGASEHSGVGDTAGGGGGVAHLEKHPSRSTLSTAASKRLSGRPTSTSILFRSTNSARVYTCPADVLWDAMKWFRRSRDLFQQAGDEIQAAKAASALAKCHLLPTFTAHALFRVPVEVCSNLSVAIKSRSTDMRKLIMTKSFSLTHNQSADEATLARKKSLGVKGLGTNARGTCFSQSMHQLGEKQPNHLGSISLGGERRQMQATPSPSKEETVMKRAASLEEAQSVMRFALDISVESCLPLMLIDAQINMAELSILLGSHYDAVAFWWESRELFLHIFADSTLLPTIRRAPLCEVETIVSLLERLVRFLWICDRAIVNHNLFILDMYIAASGELSRVRRLNLEKAALVSGEVRCGVHASSNLGSTGGLLSPSSINEMDNLSERSATTITSAPEPVASRGKVHRMSNAAALEYTSLTTLLESITPLYHTGGAATETSPYQALKKVQVPSQSEPTKKSSKEQMGARLKAESDENMARKAPLVALQRHYAFPAFSKRLFYSGMDQSGKQFCNLLNESLIREKVVDFGWQGFVEAIPTKIRGASGVVHSSAAVPRSGGGPIVAVQKHANGTEIVPSSTYIVVSPIHQPDPRYKNIPSFLKAYTLQRGEVLGEEEEEDDDDLDDVFGDLDGESSDGPTRSGGHSRSSSLGDGESTDHSAASRARRRRAAALRARLLPEEPLDPYTDFEWMDTDNRYATHWVPSMLDAHAAGEAATTRAMLTSAVCEDGNGSKLGLPAASALSGADLSSLGHFTGTKSAPPSLLVASLLPELVVDCPPPQPTAVNAAKTGAQPTAVPEKDGDKSNNDRRNRTASVASVPADPEAVLKEAVDSLDRRGEAVMLRRVWRSFLYITNIEKRYSEGKCPLKSLRRCVREELSTQSCFMLRLRSFSRQFSGNLTAYDELLQLLRDETQNMEGFVGGDMLAMKLEMMNIANSNAAATAAAGGNMGKSAGSPNGTADVLRKMEAKRAVNLQHRLQHVVYALQVSNLLLLYRPHNGAQHVQLLGGAPYVVFSEVAVPPTNGLMDSRSEDVAEQQHAQQQQLLGQGPGIAAAAKVVTDSSLSRVKLHSRGKHNGSGGSNLASLSWSDASDSTAARSIEGSENEEFVHYKPKGKKEVGLVPDVLVENFRDSSLTLNSPVLHDATLPIAAGGGNSGFEIKRLSMGSRQSSMHARLELNRTDSIQSEKSVLRSLSNMTPRPGASSTVNYGDGSTDTARPRQMYRNLMYLTFLDSAKDPIGTWDGRNSAAAEGGGLRSRPGSSSIILNTALSSDETLLILGMICCDGDANTSTRSMVETGPKTVSTRKALLEKMKKGVLLHAIKFLAEASTSHDLNSLTSMVRNISVSDDINLMHAVRPSFSDDMSRSMSEKSPLLNRHSLNRPPPVSLADSIEVGIHSNAPSEVSVSPRNSSAVQRGGFMQGISKLLSGSFRYSSESGRLSKSNTTDDANFGVDGILLASKTVDEVDLLQNMKNKTAFSKSASSYSNNALRTRPAATPLQPLPLTMLCSPTLQLLPWELLLPQSRVVRSVHLMGLCSFVLERDTSPTVGPGTTTGESNGASNGALPSNASMHHLEGNLGRMYSANGKLIRPSYRIRGLLGPKWTQHPVFVTVGHRPIASPSPNATALLPVSSFASARFFFASGAGSGNISDQQSAHLALRRSVLEWQKRRVECLVWTSTAPSLLPSAQLLSLSSTWAHSDTMRAVSTAGSQPTGSTAAVVTSVSAVSPRSLDFVLAPRKIDPRLEATSSVLQVGCRWPLHSALSEQGQRERVAEHCDIRAILLPSMKPGAHSSGDDSVIDVPLQGSLRGFWACIDPRSAIGATALSAGGTTSFDSSGSGTNCTISISSTGVVSAVNSSVRSTSTNAPLPANQAAELLFPVLLFTLADVTQSSDAVAYITARRADAICIFAPDFLAEIVAIEVGECLRRWCCNSRFSQAVKSSPRSTLKEAKGTNIVRTASVDSGGVDRRSGSTHFNAFATDAQLNVDGESAAGIKHPNTTGRKSGVQTLHDQYRLRNQLSSSGTPPQAETSMPNNSFDESIWQVDPTPNSSTSIYRTLSMQKTMQSPHSQPQQLLASRGKRGSTNVTTPTTAALATGALSSQNVITSSSAMSPRSSLPLPPPIVIRGSGSSDDDGTTPQRLLRSSSKSGSAAIAVEPSNVPEKSFLSRIMTFGKPTQSAAKNILRHTDSVSGDYIYDSVADDVVVEETIESVQPALRQRFAASTTPRASSTDATPMGKGADTTTDADASNHSNDSSVAPLPQPSVKTATVSASSTGRSVGRPSRGSYQQLSKANPGATAGSSVDEERTWVYHAVMETVHRLQHEHVATIVVMM